MNEELSLNSILIAIAAITALAGFLAALWKGVEALRKLTRVDERAAAEAAQNAAIAELRGRVTRCEERLAKGDVQFSDMRTDTTQMLNVLNAMLMHFISGNNNEKLREVKKDLDHYLANR